MASQLESGRRILIVDDNEVDRESVRRLLGSAYSVIEASTASEGLDICRMVEIDCVLLDYRLPDLDGIEILAELLEHGLPVLILTGKGSESIAVEAMKRGALDYLVKGRLARDTLLRSVNHALEKVSLRRQVSRQQAEVHAYVAELDAQRAELKRSNDKLAESEARLRLMLEQLPALTWTTNSGLDCTSLAGANLHLLGDCEAWLGRPVSRLFGDDVASISAHERALAGTPASFEATVRDRTYNAHVEALRNAGEIGGVIGVALDVTEARSLERQLRHSQKLEAMGQLAGGVAHDFNNILTAIVSFAEFVKDALHPEEPAYGDIEEVLRASSRAESLIRQLLTFSRSQPVEPRAVDVAELAAGMAPMLRRLVGEDLTLELRAESGVRPALVDPSGLEQVIVNLVVNARDAMPRGGSLTIETRSLALDEETIARESFPLTAGNYVLLSVADTGEGIPADRLEHIFEPFYTTKEAGKGTGLGLSTCYGIVRQAGGDISVDSQAGRGTTFEVRLPCSDRLAEDPAPPPRSARQGRGETVLIVEDDPQVRAIAARILKRAGYRVVVASNMESASSAAAHLQAGSLALLLSDVIMPDGTGADVVDRVKQTHPHAAVLYMSGYTGGALHSRGLVHEDADLLQKPFTAQALADAVRDALDRRARRLDAADREE